MRYEFWVMRIELKNLSKHTIELSGPHFFWVLGDENWDMDDENNKTKQGLRLQLFKIKIVLTIDIIPTQFYTV